MLLDKQSGEARPAEGEEVQFIDLQDAFLNEGAQQSSRLLALLDSGESVKKLHRVLHDWSGAGGMVGFPEIGSRARALDKMLSDEGRDTEIREGLQQLNEMFVAAIRRGRESRPLSSDVTQAVAGCRFGLMGFAAVEARRIRKRIEEANAFARPFKGDPAYDQALMTTCDVIICNLTGGKTDEASVLASGKPLLFIGPKDDIVRLSQNVRGGAQDFLIDPWNAEEVIVRSSLLLARAETPQPTGVKRPGTKITTVIADDDSTITALVRTTLRSYDIDCRVASDGGQALDLIRAEPPDAAVLDVNMPCRDGFEVLSAIRNDPRTKGIRVILLTARQREVDILRGFGLGADDYIVKPFSPMELVARLKRLLEQRA